MAKIKLNSILADVRGRLGNSVFSSNGAGYYMKVMSPPINPRTPGQNSRRAAFSFLVKAWSYLDSTDRDTWSTYAAQSDNTRYDWFGDPYLPSARAQFIIVNSIRLQAGLSATDTAPTGALPADLPAFSAGIDPEGKSFTSYIDPGDVFDASIEYLHAAVCLVPSVARYTPALPLRFMAVVPVSQSWPWEIDDYITDLYGAIHTQGRWFLELTPVSDECRTGTVLRLTAAQGEEV